MTQQIEEVPTPEPVVETSEAKPDYDLHIKVPAEMRARDVVRNASIPK